MVVLECMEKMKEGLYTKVSLLEILLKQDLKSSTVTKYTYIYIDSTWCLYVILNRVFRFLVMLIFLSSQCLLPQDKEVLQKLLRSHQLELKFYLTLIFTQL